MYDKVNKLNLKNFIKEIYRNSLLANCTHALKNICVQYCCHFSFEFHMILQRESERDYCADDSPKRSMQTGYNSRYTIYAINTSKKISKLFLKHDASIVQ